MLYVLLSFDKPHLTDVPILKNQLSRMALRNKHNLPRRQIATKQRIATEYHFTNYNNVAYRNKIVLLKFSDANIISTCSKM